MTGGQVVGEDGKPITAPTSVDVDMDTFVLAYFEELPEIPLQRKNPKKIKCSGGPICHKQRAKELRQLTKQAKAMEKRFLREHTPL
jgi:hypothetical protein